MSTQDFKPKCYIGSLHDGPFHWYLWKETFEGYRRPIEHRTLLCESCANRLGAWKLPEKKEETSERQQSAK